MEIKPCPFCGSENVKYSSLAGCVMCKDCYSYGPCGATNEDAIKKWNAAPRWEETSAPLPLCNKPLNTSNLRGLEPFLEADEGDMDVIQVIEPMVNRYQMAAEEAAELAQALLKYCRACGHGSCTPINPKDATDAVIEEYADLLLAMEASFPRCEGNKMFYSNLERVYKEKAKRWAERLKDHDD